MNDSEIKVGAGGTMFAGHDAVKLFQAVALRNGLKLLKAGIKPSRGWTKAKALAACKQFTGKTYKWTQLDEAVADLNVWIETMKSAIPVVRENK